MACVDILELRIIFKRFVKQSPQPISTGRPSRLFPLTPVFCGRGRRESWGWNVHRTTHGEDKKTRQTAADVTVPGVSAFCGALALRWKDKHM